MTVVERIFHVWKGGERVPVRFTGGDTFKRQATFEPIDRTRVCGIDTESLVSKGKLRTLLVPIGLDDTKELVETPEGTDMLQGMFEVLGRRFGVPDDAPSRTLQRKRAKDGRRPGRRDTIDPALLVFFNLPYDIGRLASDRPMLLRAIASGADTYRVDCGRFEIEVCRMVLAAGASFEWMVRWVENGQSMIARYVGIDMTGYWKTSLAKAAKAAGVTDKIEIEKDWYTREREDFAQEEWDEFKRYALGDVQTTMELYHATVRLLCTIDARVVRRNGVIPPSAPGAAARIVFARSFDIHEVDEWKRYPAWADQAGCDSYAGGRSFNRKRGVFRAMNVRDLKSAYPWSMSLLPDPVGLRCEAVVGRFDRRMMERIRGKFGVLYIDGESFDAEHPPFRIHDGKNHRLRYVYGKFRNVAVTIPEIVIGIESGVLKVDFIRRGVIMHGDRESSFLRRGMYDFFGIKEDATYEKAIRDMAKLLANSTYGKFVEVQQTQYWIESDVLVPGWSDMEKAARILARMYAEMDPAFYDDAVAGLVERSRRHRIDCDEPGCSGCGAEPLADSIHIPLRRRMSMFKDWKAGRYFLPLYASQTTGLVSASLCLMARVTCAIQGDTDSVHHEGMPSDEDYHVIMERSGYDHPYEGIGKWAIETSEASVESVCVRPKVYSHRFEHPDSSGMLYKQAKHGFAKFGEKRNGESDTGYRNRIAGELHEAMKKVLSGRSFGYDTRPSPRRLREAVISGQEVGEFVSRWIEVNDTRDPNTWIGKDGITRWKPLEEETIQEIDSGRRIA